MNDSALTPLIIAVPMLSAALLVATQSIPRRLIAEAVGLSAALVSTVLCCVVLGHVIERGDTVYWFGGWRPHHGIALGISFAVDPFGAGLAAFSGLLTIAALVFSWRHFEVVGHAFPALMLVFLAAIMGFCLSGDLFNMFVFFELMTVTGIALTGHRADERAPLQGALNFGITNALGGFFVLFGIALLYGRTGALNLAQIGVSLSHHRVDGLVAVSFGLIIVGFFVKAAIVPFHFWLADAYASAPTPVCVVFAGVMSELGLYGAARVYWTVFAGPLEPHAAALRLTLVISGAVTALGGAVMCLLQHRLKRLLAFATISYMGVFLIGIGLLTAEGLAGAAVSVVADGLLKASLFLCVGILQYRRSDSSLRVRGLGRGMPFTGTVFALGALGLAATPGWGSFLGRTLIDSAAKSDRSFGWVPVVLTVTEILLAAAVIAAAGRVFLDWGARLPEEVQESGDGRADDDGDEDDEQMSGPTDRTPALLFIPALVLSAASIAIGLLPDVERIALAGAQRFENTSAYVASTLGGHAPGAVTPLATTSLSVQDILSGIGFTAVAMVLASIILLPQRPGAAIAPARAAARRLHDLHSGHIGDYVAWLAVGGVVFTGVFALLFA